tara:strand:+ start:4587 stop:6845 length:2259 start_codon:yes stop_codon:yes gene_type:complete
MDHFINVIFSKQLNEDKRDIVLDTMISTARVGLTEDSVEYELIEKSNKTTLRLPLSSPIEEKNQQAFVEALANKLFDKGHNNFEIELTEATLRNGSRGPAVKALQQMLGMPPAEQDGIYGPKTEAAVRKFQQRAGIQVDGIAGGQTQSALAAGGAPRNAGPVRPAERPFTPGSGSTTQAPPQNQNQGVTGSNRGMDVDASGPIDAVRQMAQDQQAQQADVDPRLQNQRGFTPGQQTQPEDPRLQNRRGFTPGQQTEPNAAAAQNNDRVGVDTGTVDGPVGRGMVQADTPPNNTNPDANDPRAGNADSGFRAPPPTVSVTTQDQANSILQNPDATEEEIQAAREFYGAEPPSNQAPNVDTDAGANAQSGLGQNDTSSQQGATIDNTDDQAVNRGIPPVLQQPENNDTATDFAAAVEPADQGGANRVLSNNMPPEVFQAAEATAGDLTSDNVDNLKSVIDNADMPPILSQTTLQYLDQMYPNEDLADPEILADASEDEKLAAQALLDLKASLGGAAQDVNIDTSPPASLDQTGTAGGIDADVNAATSAPQFHNIQQNGRVFRVINPGGQMVGKSYRTAQQARSAAQALNREAGAFATDPVDPRPTGVFNNRAKNDWDAQFGITHNRDGSPITETTWNRKPILAENIEQHEVTYNDDDRFYEDYGVLWFNEDEMVDEAEYQGRKVKLGKPMAGDVKKFKVYVKNPKGNVVKVNFGQKGAKIKKSNPERRRSFRARHNCDNPGPRHKARYWSCRKW